MSTLYLGLEIPSHLQKESVVHCPFIRIVPKPVTDPAIMDALQNFRNYTHILFTSRNAVAIFFDLAARSFCIKQNEIADKIIISVGQRTAEKLKEYHVEANIIAKNETAEGIVEALHKLHLKNSHVFLPQSAISRTTLRDWLSENKIQHTACPIYDTLPILPNPLPDPARFEQIIFTSPSIVEAFAQAYKTFPPKNKCVCIGPVTQKRLNELILLKGTQS